MSKSSEDRVPTFTCKKSCWIDSGRPRRWLTAPGGFIVAKN